MANAIKIQALESAKCLLENGWIGNGDAYDVGTYYGDSEALGERLRRRPTKAELRELEEEIRKVLTAAAE